MDVISRKSISFYPIYVVSSAKIRLIGDNSAIAKILTDEEIEKIKQDYEDDDFYNVE